MESAGRVNESGGLSAQTLLYGVDDAGARILLRSVAGSSLKSEHFAIGSVKSLHIGPHLRKVEVPRVGDALLESVSVDSFNPCFSTDGICLFSKDGTQLLNCVVRTREYTVPAGCVTIGPRAFAYNDALEHILLPDGLESIGERAFIASKLEEVSVPPSVRTIGPEAFARSSALRTVSLAEGLREVGKGAFKGCPMLERLDIPASVAVLGEAFFQPPDPWALHEHAPVHVDSSNRNYLVDDQGVLYRIEGRRLVLLRAFALVDGVYIVRTGTVRIEAGAFAYQERLERVRIPEGVMEIGSEAFLSCTGLVEAVLPDGLERIDWKAFAGCVNLQLADLPDSVRSIGGCAFYRSALVRIHIPAALEHLGHLAFYLGVLDSTQDEAKAQIEFMGVPFFTGEWLMKMGHAPGDGDQTELDIASLTTGGEGQAYPVSIGTGNGRFEIIDGFLCEKLDDGRVRAVLYIGGARTIMVPSCVSWVCAFALHGAKDVRELRVHSGIERVDNNGLALPETLDCIRVDMGDGRVVCVYPASGRIGMFAQNHGYSHGRFEIAQMVSACDNSIINMRRGLERTKRILKRLENGEMISEAAREVFERCIADNIDDIITEFAKVDDIAGLRTLVQLGFVDDGTIAHAIDVANAAGGIAATHFLLEEKRARCGHRMLGLDL